jgi:hypothetical protein
MATVGVGFGLVLAFTSRWLLESLNVGTVRLPYLRARPVEARMDEVAAITAPTEVPAAVLSSVERGFAAAAVSPRACKDAEFANRGNDVLQTVSPRGQHCKTLRLQLLEIEAQRTNLEAQQAILQLSLLQVGKKIKMLYTVFIDKILVCLGGGIPFALPPDP